MTTPLVRNGPAVLMDNRVIVKDGEVYNFNDHEVEGRVASGHWSYLSTPDQSVEQKESAKAPKAKTSEVDA